MHRKHLPIRFKLFIVYALIAILVLTAGFALLYFHIHATLQQRIENTLARTTQALTDMVETTVQVSAKNHLRGIAEKNGEIVRHFYENAVSGKISMKEAQANARQVLMSQTIGHTGYLYCIDSRGIAVVHPRAGVVGRNFSHRHFIQKQIHAKEGYLEYDWKNPEDTTLRPKALYMTYFEPWDWIISVSSYKAEFDHLIDISDFKKQILSIKMADSGYAYVLDMQGNTIIHPEMNSNESKSRNATGERITDTFVRKKAGYLTYMWKNPSDNIARQKFAAFNTIPSLNWIIVSSCYSNEIFAPLRDLRNSFFIILTLMIFIVAAATLLVSAPIVRPLQRFVAQLENLAPGDWKQRFDCQRNDEMGTLSKSFNRFMERLQQYQQELQSQIAQTESKQTEINNLQRYLADIIDSMPLMLIGLDTAGRITQWNRTATERTGIQSVAAFGRPIDELLPYFATKMPFVYRAIEEGHIQELNRENNGDVIEDIRIYPVADAASATVCGAVVLIDDVTGHVRMEEMLVQSEKMLSLGGLAAGMAHEINNPLAGLIQTAYVTQSRLGDLNLPANIEAAAQSGLSMEQVSAFMTQRRILKNVGAMIESAQRIADIVENMLNFSRIPGARMELHNPVSLLNKTLELAATDYDLKKNYDFRTINIVKEYDTAIPPIPCESSKIQQVLLNILSNGAHAMHVQVSVPDNSPQFIIRMIKEPDMLRIEIEDNGPGMDQATQSRIFEPFFTTKPVGTGTGLGLSVSYFIITQNHNGTIAVESAPETGTIFIIRLPLKQAGL